MTVSTGFFPFFVHPGQPGQGSFLLCCVHALLPLFPLIFPSAIFRVELPLTTLTTLTKLYPEKTRKNHNTYISSRLYQSGSAVILD